MSKLCIVVDRLSDWASYYHCDHVVSAEEYLGADPSPDAPALVINLCRDYQYLGKGYYSSLLAEARGDRVIPSVRTINELSRRSMYTLGLSSLAALLKKNQSYLEKEDASHYLLHIYFGSCAAEELQSLARQLFDLFPCPLLEVRFKRSQDLWSIENVRTFSIHKLTPTQEDQFAAALDRFSQKIWRRSRSRKRYAYDLAMLIDEAEPLPPSNKKALSLFVQAGQRMGIDVSMVSKRDYGRLSEYDGLFIRETTAVDHHTYRFAQKAEYEQIPVVDDPNSILKCANKVYLAELLRENSIATPKTFFLYRDNPQTIGQAVAALGFPLVLKVPDGSFSRGVHKVSSLEELNEQVNRLFKASVLVLAQEYMYTDFDWRVGVLGGKALFACRYYMSDGHWQIYNHGAKDVRKRTGTFDTLAVEQAPSDLVRLAVKSCGLIGSGLYGIDIKQSGDRFSVIEINDNPNIDAGVEDLHLGPVLYNRVMDYFFQKLEQRRFRSRS